MPKAKVGQQRAGVRKTAPAKAASGRARPSIGEQPIDEQVEAALGTLKRMSTQRDRENLGRFGITATKYFGVSVSNTELVAENFQSIETISAFVKSKRAAGN